MAFDPYLYYYATCSATPGTNTALIRVENTVPNQFFVGNWQLEGGSAYIRIAYSTNSSVSTPSYGATMSEYIGGFSEGILEADFVLTGLTPGSTYYWKPQIASTDTTTAYIDGDRNETTTAYPTFTPSTAGTAPVANFSVNSTTAVAYLAATFTDLSTGTPYEWNWAIGTSGGVLASGYTASNPTVYLNAGTYTVTLTATNAYGTDSEVKASYITVLSDKPNPSWTQNTTVGDRPLVVTYTGTATSINTIYGFSGWQWSLPNGVSTESPSTQNAVVTYNVAGTYPATLTATSYLGSGSSVVTNAVTVRPISAGATFTASPRSGAAPLSVQFLGTPTGDTTGVLWNFGDGSTTTALNPSHLYATVATYTPTYTVYGTTTPVSAAVSVSTATGTSWITAETTTTYKELLEELRRQLLLNTDTGTVCTDFVSWGGASVVLKHIYNRICRLQLETGLLRKTSTTITGSAGLLTLPTDLVEIRSIYVNGVRLEKCDPRMADLADPDWISRTSGDYLGWYTNPADHLKLQLVPPVNPSTFEVYYVYLPTEPTVPNDCATSNWATNPLPFVYWWVIKYGVLSDLLQQEGDMYDIERAHLCEQLWNEGVEMIKLTLDGK